MYGACTKVDLISTTVKKCAADEEMDTEYSAAPTLDQGMLKIPAASFKLGSLSEWAPALKVQPAAEVSEGETTQLGTSSWAHTFI